MTTQAQATCPSQHLHQWHPTGYVQHSSWAADAVRIANQRPCPGCGHLEIWVPKRDDLRLYGADWTYPTCIGVLDPSHGGFGACRNEAICERWMADGLPDRSGSWWPVCYNHTGITTVTV